MQASCNNLGARMAQDCVESIGRDDDIGGFWEQSIFERIARRVILTLL